jgi:predicted NAD/FAD-binding protein
MAVIGSGISGLVSAYLLSERYDVSLFEKNDYLGGHTHTVEFELEGDHYSIDTGFIVFNKKTYPNFCQLLGQLKVPIQLSEMSFSYRSDNKDFEYNGYNLNTFFSDRRNLYKPNFYRFMKNIIAFNRDAKKFLTEENDSSITIKAFLAKRHYSKTFIECYFLPMLGAIWSKNKEDVLSCSAYFIFKFYANHGLLDLYDRPPWYVIAQGSKNYIRPMVQNLKNKIYLNTPVDTIKRKNNQIIIHSGNHEFIFDAVIIATHSDQALQLLFEPTESEVRLLSSIKYTENNVILHTDERVMPKRKRAWASWNYLDNERTSPTLTYYMNRLQSIQSNINFFVSVNLEKVIDSHKIIQHFKYAHPCLDVGAIKAQEQIGLINGIHNTYFVGSYWGYGFHEEGVNSAINTCKLIGNIHV